MTSDPRHAGGARAPSAPRAPEAGDSSAPAAQRASDLEPEATASGASAAGANASPADHATEPTPQSPSQAETEQEEPESHEAKLEHDLEELAARAEKADEYLELAQRTKADFENYRKRAAREAAAAQDRGVLKLVKELLPAVDNLDRALAAAQASDNGSDLLSGIKLVHADVIAALARCGVEPYSPEGERFDPEHHEAVAQQPVEGAAAGTVVEVYQRGYRLGESVIRPAKVVVAG